MLEHDFSEIPIDSEVKGFCKSAYGVEPQEIGSFFADWGSHKFLGYKLGRQLIPPDTNPDL